MPSYSFVSMHSPFIWRAFLETVPVIQLCLLLIWGSRPCDLHISGGAGAAAVAVFDTAELVVKPYMYTCDATLRGQPI